MATETVATWVDGSGPANPGSFPSPGNVADLAPGGVPWNTYDTQGGATELHIAQASWPGCASATAVTAEITVGSFEYLSSSPGGGGGAELIWALNDAGGANIASGIMLMDSVGPATYGPFTSGPVALSAAQIAAGVTAQLLVDVFNPQKNVNIEGGRLIIDGDIDACVSAVVPNTVDDTATTPVNVPVTVSVGTNDDPSPCAPGCMVHRQPTTNFIDPASTATGITASVDVAGVATLGKCPTTECETC